MIQACGKQFEDELKTVLFQFITVRQCLYNMMANDDEIDGKSKTTYKITLVVFGWILSFA